MNAFAIKLIDDLGGTAKVASLIQTPITTVHAWRKSGIPPARLHHIELAAKAAGLPWTVEVEQAA